MKEYGSELVTHSDQFDGDEEIESTIQTIQQYLDFDLSEQKKDSNRKTRKPLYLMKRDKENSDVDEGEDENEINEYFT